MAAAHKGAISFGLVHIPIELYKKPSRMKQLLISYVKIRMNVFDIKNIVLAVAKKSKMMILSKAISMKKIAMSS